MTAAAVRAGPGPSRLPPWAFAAVGLVAFAVFAQTLAYELVWDDGKLLSFIAEVTSKKGVVKLLASEFILEDDHTGYYRPVVLASLWLDSRLATLFPPAFHLVNICLHTATSLLVLRLITALGFPLRAALAGAILFAVHPVHSESVAFVSGRTDLWAALFVICCAIIWVEERTAGSGSTPRRGTRALGLACFALAILAKENAFMLPVVLLGWDLLGVRNTGFAQSWWERNRFWIIGWGLATAAMLVLRALALGGWAGLVRATLGAGAPAYGAAPAPGPLLLLCTYLRLLLVPWPLNAFYTADALRWSTSLFASAALVFGICGFLGGVQHRRAGLLALVWLAAFLVPVLGAVPVRGGALAERFLYLPSVGFALAAGSLIDAPGLRRGLRKAVLAASLAVGVLFVAATVARSAVWRNELVFFQELIRSSPTYSSGHYNLGLAYEKRGEYRKATAAYETTLRLQPDHYKALLNIGNIAVFEGRLPEALTVYQKVLQVQPGYPTANYNIGRVYQELGNAAAAVRHYEEAARLKPDYYRVYSNLGAIYLESGNYSQAIELYRKALRFAPGDGYSHLGLGIALLQTGARAAALEEYRVLSGLDRSLAEKFERALSGHE